MRRRKRARPEGDYLEHRVRVNVRFQEVDSMQVVWHGHYVSYLEDARVAFGREYGIGYDDIRRAGLAAPIVHLRLLVPLAIGRPIARPTITSPARKFMTAPILNNILSPLCNYG